MYLRTYLCTWACMRIDVCMLVCPETRLFVQLFFPEVHRKYQSLSHYSDVIMGAMASQLTGVFNVCSTVGADADQRKHQSSASLAFVRGIHRSPVNSPHKRPVTRKMFPFDDVIMVTGPFLLESTIPLTKEYVKPSHAIASSWICYSCSALSSA